MCLYILYLTCVGENFENEPSVLMILEQPLETPDPRAQQDEGRADQTSSPGKMGIVTITV